MYRLFPCIPIFRVFLFFYIKSAKRMCICVYVKNRIGTCSNLRFGGKKGYKQIITLDSPKACCFRDTLSWNTTHIMAAISYFPVCGSFRRTVIYCYMTEFAGMKFQPVQLGQISPYEYMWKLNFVRARRDSFPIGISLDLNALSLNL